MFEIEEASIPLSGNRTAGWEERREEIITRLVERRTAECSGQSILNLGANQVQKKPILNRWSSVTHRLIRTATPDRPAPYVVSFVPMAGRTRARYYLPDDVEFDLYKTATPDDLIGVLGWACHHSRGEGEKIWGAALPRVALSDSLTLGYNQVIPNGISDGQRERVGGHVTQGCARSVPDWPTSLTLGYFQVISNGISG